ncbi:MAG TPA: DNA primase, partial [Rikenellaceae bacterium]|nr:DNA primase [Rikenellaceae bacterium]
MISKSTIDKILDTAQIVDVINDFVTLKKRGANYIACCPFHNEKTPSFSVSPSKGIFKCFGCGKAGNVVNFIMEHEQLGYVEALKYLGRKYGIEVTDQEESAEEQQNRLKSESLMVVSQFASEFYSNTLWNSPSGQAIGLTYFKERGFSEKTIRKFMLGWAPSERDALSNAAIRTGYKKEYLVSAGLSIETENGKLFDRFYERVIFPIHSVSGKVIAFGGRTLKTDKSTAKYINSPESEIYVKSKSLYGIFFAKSAISKFQNCYLVEGYTDVLSLHQAGVENVVASSGTSLTSDQIRLIRRFSPAVTILYDGDAAGIKASIRGIDMLLEEGLQVKVVLFPDGEDPDSFARSHSPEELKEFLKDSEQDFITFKSNLLAEEARQDPLKKVQLISDVVASIAVIPDAISRSVYIEDCSRRLNIDEKVLVQEVRRIRQKKQYGVYSQTLPSEERRYAPEYIPVIRT